MQNTLLVFLGTALFSGAQEVIKLWEGEVPFSKKAKAENVITEKRPGEFRITEVTDPEITVYPASPETHNGMGLVICPGGGYVHLGFKGKGIDFAKHFTKEGFTCFVLHYQVPKNRKGALSDAGQAMKIIRSRSQEWKINPAKIGMIGTSAGGHLIAALSAQTKEPKLRPNFAILLCPAYLTDKKSGKLSAEFTELKDTPPFFIFTAEDDKGWIEGSRVFAKALKEKNLPHEVHLVPKGGHGFGLKEGNPAAETWPALALKWIEGLNL